jgi:23S rRNA pseudouridine1911/1915/1917 synthase
LVVAKRKPALEALAQQFRVHTIERVYLGVVCGAPRWPEVSLRTRHGRDPKERRRFSPDVDRGRWAITHAWRERVFVDAAVLRFELETGRTHQIRMHARHLGHPIVGDALYGPRAGSPRVRALAKTLGRHALHAASLGFCHPSSGQTLRFRASLPPELQTLVTALARG